MEADICHWLARNRAAYSDSGHIALHCRSAREVSWAVNNAFDSIVSILKPGFPSSGIATGKKPRNQRPSPGILETAPNAKYRPHRAAAAASKRLRSACFPRWRRLC
jgi:hypothetical protein